MITILALLLRKARKIGVKIVRHRQRKKAERDSEHDYVTETHIHALNKLKAKLEARI